MEFKGSIDKIAVVAKDEKEYLQLTLLVPIDTKSSDVTQFTRHFRNTSEFTIEPLQRNLGV